MKFPICVACGPRDDLQHHHLVTRAEGGSGSGDALRRPGQLAVGEIETSSASLPR